MKKLLALLCLLSLPVLAADVVSYEFGESGSWVGSGTDFVWVKASGFTPWTDPNEDLLVLRLWFDPTTTNSVGRINDSASTNDFDVKPSVAAGGVWTIIGTNSDGRVEHAPDLDGSDDHYDRPDTAALDMGTRDFSVSWWFKSPGPFAVLAMKAWDDSTVTGSPGWLLMLGGGGLGRVRLMLADGGQGAALTVVTGDTTNLFDSTWHFSTVSLDRSGSAFFYLDGAADGSGVISGESGSLSTTYPMILGNSFNKGGSRDRDWTGFFDDIRIHTNKVISLAEHADIYTNTMHPNGQIETGY